GAPTQLGIAVPAEHEERSFYSADVPQGHRQSVCPGAGLDYPRTFTTSPETTSATAYGYPRRSSRRSAMSVCGRPDTAAILLPSPMALPPLRNGGRRIPEASANDGCTRGRPRRHGSVRPSPETCAGNQVQRPAVEWCPPDRRTTSLRGSEGDTQFHQFPSGPSVEIPGSLSHDTAASAGCSAEWHTRDGP